jgi:hypothetical protein
MRQEKRGIMMGSLSPEFPYPPEPPHIIYPPLFLLPHFPIGNEAGKEGVMLGVGYEFRGEIRG